MWKQCSLEVPHDVDTQCMRSQPRGPTRPLGCHPIPIWNSLLDSHRTVDVQVRFRRTCPINETSVGNDDPNQSHTSLAVCAKWWSLIDAHDTCAVCESHRGSKKES